MNLLDFKCCIYLVNLRQIQKCCNLNYGNIFINISFYTADALYVANCIILTKYGIHVYLTKFL